MAAHPAAAVERFHGGGGGGGITRRRWSSVTTTVTNTKRAERTLLSPSACSSHSFKTVIREPSRVCEPQLDDLPLPSIAPNFPPPRNLYRRNPTASPQLTRARRCPSSPHRPISAAPNPARARQIAHKNTFIAHRALHPQLRRTGSRKAPPRSSSDDCPLP